MVYYNPYIPGWLYPLYDPTNRVFFIAHLAVALQKCEQEFCWAQSDEVEIQQADVERRVVKIFLDVSVA